MVPQGCTAGPENVAAMALRAQGAGVAGPGFHLSANCPRGGAVVGGFWKHM